MAGRRNAKRTSLKANQNVTKRVRKAVQVVENGAPAAEQQPAVAPQQNGPQEVELAVQGAPEGAVAAVAPRRSRRLNHPLKDHNDLIYRVIVAALLPHVTLPSQLAFRLVSKLWNEVVVNTFEKKCELLVVTLKDRNKVKAEPLLFNRQWLNYGNRYYYDANMRDHMDKLEKMEHREIVITSRHFDHDETKECIGRLFGKVKHLVIVMEYIRYKSWFLLQVIERCTELKSLAVIYQSESVQNDCLSHLFRFVSYIPSTVELHLCFSRNDHSQRVPMYPAVPAQNFKRSLGLMRRFSMVGRVENMHEIIQAVGRNIARLVVKEGDPAPEPLQSIGMPAMLDADQLDRMIGKNPALGNITQLQLYHVVSVDMVWDYLESFPMLQSLQLWGPKPFRNQEFTNDHLEIVSQLVHLRDLSLFGFHFEFNFSNEIQQFRSEVRRLRIVCEEFFTLYLMRKCPVMFYHEVKAEDAARVLRPLFNFNQQFPMLDELTIEADLGPVLPYVGVIKQELVKLFYHLKEEKVRLVNNRSYEIRENGEALRNVYKGSYAVY